MKTLPGDPPPGFLNKRFVYVRASSVTQNLNDRVEYSANLLAPWQPLPASLERKWQEKGHSPDFSRIVIECPLGCDTRSPRSKTRWKEGGVLKGLWFRITLGTVLPWAQKSRTVNGPPDFRLKSGLGPSPPVI